MACSASSLCVGNSSSSSSLSWHHRCRHHHRHHRYIIIVVSSNQHQNFCILRRRKTPFDPSAPRPSAPPESGTARSALALRPTTTRSQELAWVQHEKSTDLSRLTRLRCAGTGARRPSLWRSPIPNATAGMLRFQRPFFRRAIFRQVPPLYREPEANLFFPTSDRGPDGCSDHSSGQLQLSLR